jgi:hypothetical protein
LKEKECGGEKRREEREIYFSFCFGDPKKIFFLPSFGSMLGFLGTGASSVSTCGTVQLVSSPDKHEEPNSVGKINTKISTPHIERVSCFAPPLVIV